MIFGDIIAVALMKKKQVSLKQYSSNHPFGTIGKKATLTVEQIMRKGDDIPISYEDELISDVIPTLSSKRCGAIIIISKKFELLGFFTDGDLRRAIENLSKDIFTKKICDFMTKNPKTIVKDMLAWDALKLMEQDSKKLVSVLPVIENDKVVGILHMHDILQAGLSL